MYEIQALINAYNHIACLGNQWLAGNILRSDDGIIDSTTFIKKFKKQPDVVWASNQTR